MPKHGDVIKVKRWCGIYSHYGVYVDEGNGVRVIHYAETKEGKGKGISRGNVQETSLKEFLDGAKECSVVEFSESEYKTIHTPEKTVELAKLARDGKEIIIHNEETNKDETYSFKSYDLLFSNCEHFARFCKTGKKKSKQVRNGAMIVGAICAVILGVLLGGGRNREDEHIDIA